MLSQLGPEDTQGPEKSRVRFLAPKIREKSLGQGYLGESERILGSVCRFIEQRASMLHCLNGAQESSRSRAEMAASSARCSHRVFHYPPLHVAQSGMAIDKA